MRIIAISNEFKYTANIIRMKGARYGFESLQNITIKKRPSQMGIF